MKFPRDWYKIVTYSMRKVNFVGVFVSLMLAVSGFQIAYVGVIPNTKYGTLDFGPYHFEIGVFVLLVSLAVFAFSVKR